MIAREAILNDAGVAELLKSKFVSVAFSNTPPCNLTAGESQWLRSHGIAFCTQGMAVLTADGKVLSSGGGYTAAGAKAMLEKGLAAFKPEQSRGTAVEPAAGEALRKPPEGGLVMFVTWRIVAGLETCEAPGPYDKLRQRAMGVDRLWVRKDEVESLTRGTFPDSLKKRIAPSLWQLFPAQARKDLQATLSAGRITGSFPSEDPSVPTEVAGVLEAANGKVTRFDIVVRGQVKRIQDHGSSASLGAIPEGKTVTVGILFSLADPQDDLARVMPARATGDAYLK